VVRVSGAAAQLLWSRGPAATSTGGDPASLLSLSTFVGAAGDGRARHAGHGDRLSGSHFGRLFPDASSDPARILPSPDDRAHFGARDRTSVSTVDQLGALCRRRRTGSWLPFV